MKKKLSDNELLKLISRNINFDQIFKEVPSVSKQDIEELFNGLEGLLVNHLSDRNRIDKLIVNTDGASRGNPGKAGIGVVISDDNGNVIGEVSEFIGETTNNVAEYKAFILGLKKVHEFKPVAVEVRSDSDLLVKQLNSVYKVKDEKIKPLYKKSRELIREFQNFKVVHIPREENKLADTLANNAIEFAEE